MHRHRNSKRRVEKEDVRRPPFLQPIALYAKKQYTTNITEYEQMRDAN